MIQKCKEKKRKEKVIFDVSNQLITKTKRRGERERMQKNCTCT